VKPTPLPALIAGLALALALLGAVAWVSLRQFDRVERTAATVSDTHHVLSRLARVLSLVQDVETGARGFLVTGDPAFLAPYEAARGAMNSEMAALCPGGVDAQRRQRHCDVLAPLIAERIGSASQTVEVRRTAGFEAAQRLVAAGAGKATMDEIRALVGTMEADEETLLSQRTAVAQSEADTARMLVSFGIGVALLLLAGTFALVVRENHLHRRSQEELDRFFTLSLDMLVIADLNGYFLRVSPSFTRTLGHTTDELVARPFLDFVHPDDRAATLAEMEKLGRGAPTIHFENRYRCKDGSWRWLSWMTQPVTGGSRLYGAARDMTERREAEEDVARLNRDLQRHTVELAAANKELESFSYSVSHDLRAPLRSIDGFSQVLQEDCDAQLTDDGKDALMRIRRAATTMGQLIDALLVLSRVTRADLRTEHVDLSQMATAIVGELQQLQPERPVEFLIAPGLSTDGDPPLLRAALANLLGNAWKYTRTRATPLIEFGRIDLHGEMAYFVRDNGVGFDMAYVGMLFGAFQRLHRQAEFGGTGIGLATVQRIIHRHHGRVWAEGEVDRGATFYFTLPDRTRSDAT